MPTVKAVLLKPLDGLAEGAEREFEKVDFEQLRRMGAVKAVEPRAKAAPAVLNKAAPAPLNKGPLRG